MPLLLFILFTTLSLQAQALQKSAHAHQESVVISEQEHRDALQIGEDYKTFIETKPSSKKRALALLIKNKIEDFEAKYEKSPLLPATLRLLEEVDFYLDGTS